jgi:hypothetical protein
MIGEEEKEGTLSIDLRDILWRQNSRNLHEASGHRKQSKKDEDEDKGIGARWH